MVGGVVWNILLCSFWDSMFGGHDIASSGRDLMIEWIRLGSIRFLLLLLFWRGKKKIQIPSCWWFGICFVVVVAVFVATETYKTEIHSFILSHGTQGAMSTYGACETETFEYVFIAMPTKKKNSNNNSHGSKKLKVLRSAVVLFEANPRKTAASNVKPFIAFFLFLVGSYQQRE